jgi:hypothetical protein
MTYEIKDYTKKQATKLGVLVYPSDNKKYKIEIYDAKTGEFMFYGGSPAYKDFPTYIEDKGLEYANERRRLYRIRHKKEIENKGSRGWYIANLLW